MGYKKIKDFLRNLINPLLPAVAFNLSRIKPKSVVKSVLKKFNKPSELVATYDEYGREYKDVEGIRIYYGKSTHDPFIENILLVLVALGLKPSARLSRQDATELLRKATLSRPYAL